ncbi:MAG: hypothetical protein MUC83_06755, partial [Pirellula sp.]|nr:hypothetical protein [Pirellula sp.]
MSTKKGEPAALKPVFAGGNRTEFGVTLKNGSLYFMSKTYLSTSSVIPKGETRLLHTHDRSESLASERTILARLILQDDFESEDPFDELRGLAETAGTTVMATIYQKREHPDQTTYLG